MKQIIAIVQPHRLDTIEQALHGIEHLPGFTIFPARGHPRGRGPQHAFAATEWDPDIHERLVLILFCSDELAPRIAETIRTAAHTGNPGDGLIAVSSLDDVLRIRSGERGDAAL
jgi:nitrogen regulatory protein P-II 1